jgi:hypothetical protein
MFKYIAMVMALILGYVFYQMFPDLRRYMRIRSM